MKEILLQLAAYQTWANQLLLETIYALPADKQQQPVAGSFPTLYHCVLHMYDAESIWWQRVKLQEHVRIPSQDFTGDMKELGQLVLLQNRQWKDWISMAGEHMLQHEFKYQNSKRESFKQPIYQMLFHLFNHGTYHRGQLVNMLRQLGVTKIPQTDFIVYARRKKPAEATVSRH